VTDLSSAIRPLMGTHPSLAASAIARDQSAVPALPDSGPGPQPPSRAVPPRRGAPPRPCLDGHRGGDPAHAPRGDQPAGSDCDTRDRVSSRGPPVRAECVAQHIDATLGLYASRVAALEAAPAPGTPAPRPDEAAPMTRRPPPVARPTRTGARAEILAAARRVMAASGRREFTVAEIVEDMRRHSTGYAQSTIRTLLTTHASRRPGRRCRRLQRRRVGQQGRPQASLRRCTLRARRS
jgi:hypothetical protein